MVAYNPDDDEEAEEDDNDEERDDDDSAPTTQPPPPSKGKGKGPRRVRKPPVETVSPYFSQPPPTATAPKRRVPRGVAASKWPQIGENIFGLIQEELFGNTYHLLVATTFLNRTRGTHAVPHLRRFLITYPTPAALAAATIEELAAALAPLGLQNRRAATLHRLAVSWMEQPPAWGVRSGVKGYPMPGTRTMPVVSMGGMDGSAGDGRDGEDAEDGVKGWEIGHLAGIGAYALDSWRIFSQSPSTLRIPPPAPPPPPPPPPPPAANPAREGSATSSETSHELDETLPAALGSAWKHVVPADKELRAYVRWRWWRDEGVFWREEGDEFVDMTAAGVPTGVGVGEVVRVDRRREEG
ncbi:DNA glycosylase [Geopyxis carbonaria]|nr:DNA glycosylase [Geopyxis carbonaria]